jgi:antitoxin component of MazEF toxin-antitoxin module
MPLQSIWKSGNSLVVTIPAEYARKHRLQDGTIIKIATTRSGALKLTPTWLQPPYLMNDPKRRVRSSHA